MIEFTKKEVLEILKAISKLEGVLITDKATADVLDLLCSPTKILTDKLLQESTNGREND